MSTLNYSWTGRLQKSWSPFNTQRRNNRSLFTNHSIYIHLHLEHSTHIDRAVPPQRDEIFKNTNEFRPRVIGKGLADAEVEKRKEKISEDSKVGDPSYFISRWYVTPCRPSRRPLSNISVFTFDGLLSTSQPARLTRWKNKGEAAGGWEGTTGRYLSLPLMRVLAARRGNYPWTSERRNNNVSY